MFPRVGTCRDPDGQHSEDQHQIDSHDDKVQDIAQVNVTHDPHQRQRKGNFRPCRADGREGRRDVLVEEEGALGVVGVVAHANSGADEGCCCEEDHLSSG